MSVIAEPVTVGEQSVSVSACVGIASYPADADGAEELLANADLALYQAKADGPLTHRFFVHSLREAVIERRILEAELRDAFAAGQLELFYQPQIDLLTRRVLGAEALLRWRHPARGLLLPADFIDVLETSAIAPEVGEKIIETACAQAARWRASGFPDFQMSVNLFGRQIVSGRLVELVMGPIKKYGLPPSAIEIEITETTILRRDDVILAPLRQLCAAGVRIAFDDYGTGYASLSLLKDFPLSRLKIDRSFITHLADDAEDAAVVQAIIFLAKNFGLRVIAEGVETEAQAQILVARHCPEAQGFLFGRAVSADEFEKTQLKTLLGDEACAM
jgi:EAL domain-containing protein (putative c-di-GMP-specific phosphodiesterase class I)